MLGQPGVLLLALSRRGRVGEAAARLCCDRLASIVMNFVKFKYKQFHKTKEKTDSSH
jgi:hypothetical protein